MGEPAYLALLGSGELARRVDAAKAALSQCVLCPRACGVDRLKGKTGFCRTGRLAEVASYCLHFGEEAPLTGTNGSGTIFFGHCNLGCVFCQNADISGDCPECVPARPEELAGIMLELQREGAHNINLVTPSHVAPQILEGLAMAAEHGLRLPLVWNSRGYDEVSTLRLLEGVVDIYMPDAKFRDPETSSRLMQGARDYPQKAEAAIREMHAQAGDLVLNPAGVAVRGLLVRHLVMPGGLAGTGEWMRFLASLSPRMYVNVMDQYRPCGTARDHPSINRTVTPREMELALKSARDAGLVRLDERSARGYRLLMPRP